jgi:ribosomal 50S subunit-associated protein YjgA (DUF615 family)
MKLDTNESRPEVQVDWDSRFKKERKDRLADAIGEYLTDEDVTAESAYEDMIAEVEGWVKYYRTYLDKAEGLRDRLLGMKPVTFD